MIAMTHNRKSCSYCGGKTVMIIKAEWQNVSRMSGEKLSQRLCAAHLAEGPTRTAILSRLLDAINAVVAEWESTG
jgi:hypothetical protein